MRNLEEVLGETYYESVEASTPVVPSLFCLISLGRPGGEVGGDSRFSSLCLSTVAYLRLEILRLCKRDCHGKSDSRLPFTSYWYELGTVY